MSVMRARRIILGINAFDSGSTGAPLRNALKYLSKELGCDYKILVYQGSDPARAEIYGRSRPLYTKIIEHFEILRRLRVPVGTYFRVFTRRVIKSIKRAMREYDSVIVNLNNMHDGRIHNPMLFHFLRKHNVPTIYTLHDCWPFTGGCFYYGNGEMPCSRWKTGCKDCPLNLPRTEKMLRRKTQDLQNRRNVFLMPTSKWLAKEAKDSVLGNLPVFPVHTESPMSLVKEPPADYRLKWGIPYGQKIVISAGACWSAWKGPNFILEVADRLPDDYTLLIVGDFDSKGRKNIVVTGLLDNDELCRCYYIADCFVSVTQRETFGLVLPEAEMCGVPIVGFGHGGTVESVNDRTSIMVGTENDVDKLVHAIIHVVEDKPFKKEDIIAAGMRFAKGTYGPRLLPYYKKLFGMEN